MSLQRHREINEMRAGGARVKQIAAAFGVSPARVSQVINSDPPRGAPGRPPKPENVLAARKRAELARQRDEQAARLRQIASDSVLRLVAELPAQDRCRVLLGALRVARDKWHDARDG
jgi:predicted transcriptional regulator